MTPEKHQFKFAEGFLGYADIKVVGVGGGGGNALNRMIEAQLKGVEFIAINTDAQVLDRNRADKCVQIGDEITNGLGAGARPEVGRQAVEESRDKVAEAIGRPNLVFITAGMGGGTGTGAAPVVAEIAKAAGALTVAIVTKPFLFEGRRRIQRAEQGLAELKSRVDTLITIPNDRLLEIVERDTSLINAFAIADEVLHQATKGISDLITVPGLVNCDFADVRTVMLQRGDALMGTGHGKGQDKAIDAARGAVSSPLLEEVSISGAKGVLINVTGGEDMSLHDVNAATSLIYEFAGEDADIIFGAVIDPSMKDQMRVTVIATGFGGDDALAHKNVRAVAETPGVPISLFNEGEIRRAPVESRPVAKRPVLNNQIQTAIEREFHQESLEPEYPAAAPNRSGQYEYESVEQDDHVPAYSPEGTTSPTNGSRSTFRGRIPTFSEEDRSIPAFIRRLDDNG